MSHRKILIVLIILYFNALIAQSQKPLALEASFIPVASSYCSDRNVLVNSNGETLYSNIYGQFALTNKSGKSFSFWIMYCSWTDLISVKPNWIRLEVGDCDKNHPYLVTLNANESILFNSVIEIPNEYFNKSITKSINLGKSNTFNIGMLIIPKDAFEYKPKHKWDELIKALREKNEFVWTPPIKILPTNYNWNIVN